MLKKKYTYLLIIILCIAYSAFQCKPANRSNTVNEKFPQELIHFIPYAANPVFSGTGDSTWDSNIRERGYILREGDTWYLWYTGYEKGKDRHLGYAESSDGLNWKRFSDNPIHTANWVEDMCVVKEGDTYYMFAEGRDDIAHLLTSSDRIHWEEQGSLDIRMVNGEPVSKGALGTPTVWKEDTTWYLFYERNDSGIWLALSRNMKQWTNVQDEPVIKMGPEPYDQYAVALNQVIKYNGKYYGYYHASAYEDWREWSICVAVSDDLIHWEKYEHNPIIGENNSSGILVNDGKRYRLYTMHPDVKLFFPVNDSLP